MSYLLELILNLFHWDEMLLAIIPNKKHESESLYMRWGGLIIISLIVLNILFLRDYLILFISLNVILGIWFFVHLLWRIAETAEKES